MRKGVMVFSVVMMVAAAGQVMANEHEEGKGMMMKKGMGMGMHHIMMKKMEPIVVPTSDAGIVVVIGNKMTKYDQDLDVVKEVELNFEGVHKMMEEMKKSCPMMNEKAEHVHEHGDETAKENVQEPAPEAAKEVVEEPAAVTVTEDQPKQAVQEPVSENSPEVVPSEAPVEPAAITAIPEAAPETVTTTETVTETIKTTVIEPVQEKAQDAFENATQEPMVNGTIDIAPSTK